MDYTIATTFSPGPHDLGIKLTPLVQRLVEHGALLADLQRAVHPFTFTASVARGTLALTGDKAAVLVAAKVVQHLTDAVAAGRLDESRLPSVIATEVPAVLKREFSLRLRGLPRSLEPMSPAQLAFLQSLLVGDRTLVIGAGTTGTGKTHLAIAAAFNQLAEESYKRIVITRPHAIMEGEVVTASTRAELDYDSQFEYLEDIVVDLVGAHGFKELRSEGKLQLLPFGHVGGRTFNETFVIVDEAQNLTVRKMRTICTRIGRASRLVVIGDPAHADLRDGEPSGLAHLIRLVSGTELAAVHDFGGSPIIRNATAARLEMLFAAAPATLAA